MEACFLHLKKNKKRLLRLLSHNSDFFHLVRNKLPIVSHKDRIVIYRVPIKFKVKVS